MEKLANYELEGSFTNQNAGFSNWAFGKKNGKDYFIKQFVEQKYPANDSVSSPERIAKKLKACERFEQRKKILYQNVNENSDGNAVRIEEFFRIDTKYYISMRKIESLNWNIWDVSKLPRGEIKRLCAIIAHAIASLHKGQVIHADLKPDNILFMKTESGYITAKVIDFDAGFLETNPPGLGEAIVGDTNYFAPEVCMRKWGAEVELTCKMDIFALGVLFHQYFTEELPRYNTTDNTCPGEAVAKGEALVLSDKLPKDIHKLLRKMLDADPTQRPSADEVFLSLRSIETKPVPESNDPVIETTTISVNPFFRPGDL